MTATSSTTTMPPLPRRRRRLAAAASLVAQAALQATAASAQPPDVENATGRFLLTSGESGGGEEDLLALLFGKDFAFVNRDPGECESCEGREGLDCRGKISQCLDCSKFMPWVGSRSVPPSCSVCAPYSCLTSVLLLFHPAAVGAASDSENCADCDSCSPCVGCAALPEPYNNGLTPEGILALVGIGYDSNDRVKDSDLVGEDLLKRLFGADFNLSIRSSAPECQECPESDCLPCIGCREYCCFRDHCASFFH